MRNLTHLSLPVGNVAQRTTVAAVFLFLLMATMITVAAHLEAQSSSIENARTLLEKGKLVESERVLRVLIEKSPEMIEAHELLSVVLYRKHEPRASMAEMIAASKLGDLSAFDLRIFGLDCAAIPDYEEAEKWLLRSLDKDAQDGATWEALGHVRFKEKHYKDARVAFENAMKAEPGSVELESMLGMTDEALADLDGAEAAYRAANELQKDAATKDAVPIVGLGRVLLNANRAEDAIAYLQLAAKLTPSVVEPHELLGNALLRAGRAKDAVAELTRAVELEPKTARLHLLLGKALRAAGEREKAAAEMAVYEKLKASEQP